MQVDGAGPAAITAAASAASSAGVCGTEGCASRLVGPFRHALSSTLPPEMNKRGHRIVPALSIDLLGYQDSNLD